MHVSTMMILLFAGILAGILLSAIANRVVSYVQMPYGARTLSQIRMNDGVS